MSSYSRIAAVTGGNKGVGLACVRQLALQYPKSAFNNGPLLIYLTARNKERGERALGEILKDPQLKSARALRQDGGLSDVKYLALDIDSQDSISEFADTIKREHPDGIDMLINNAGVALEGFDAEVVRKTLHCNYYGTLEMCQRLLPHIREGGRVVNVASMAGHIDQRYSSAIRQRFLESRSIADVTKLMQEFHKAVEDGGYSQDWPGAAYKVSKAGVIGMSRALARDKAATGSTILINSCCPGYVQTDMTKNRGRKTPDQGAETPVMLALGDIGNSTGEFWSSGRRVDWER